MKNMIYEMKSKVEGINRLDEMEDRISDLENVVTKDTQSEQQQVKRIQKMKIV